MHTMIPHNSEFFSNLNKKAFEISVGKGENAWNQHLLLSRSLKMQSFESHYNFHLHMFSVCANLLFSLCGKELKTQVHRKKVNSFSRLEKKHRKYLL